MPRQSRVDMLYFFVFDGNVWSICFDHYSFFIPGNLEQLQIFVYPSLLSCRWIIFINCRSCLLRNCAPERLPKLTYTARWTCCLVWPCNGKILLPSVGLVLLLKKLVFELSAYPVTYLFPYLWELAMQRFFHRALWV